MEKQFKAGLMLLSGVVGLALLSRRRSKSSSRMTTSVEPSVPILAENRVQTICAWRGPSMMIVDPQGMAGDIANTGFFFRTARYLREVRLDLFGDAPFPCSVAEIAPNEMEFTYVYPEKVGGGSDQGGERNGIPYGSLDLRLGYIVRPNGIIIRLRLLNRCLEPLSVDFGWHLSADFADYAETSGERKQNAEITCAVLTSGLRFRYHHSQIPMETIVTVEGLETWNYDEGRLAARLDLKPQATTEILLKVQAVDLTDPIDEERAAKREARLARWQQAATAVETPGDSPIAIIVNNSIRDIGSMALLEGPEDEWLTPAAGIPTFQSLWGRDALTTVWQATVFDRGEMADSVLSTLGRLQGHDNNTWRDEQPGRIIRARELGPLARLNLTPMGLYFGDYASPLAFIFALAQLYAWSGERQLLRKHYDVARRIMDWASRYGDIDSDGYLEYKTLSPAGPKHQGWRDAQNAVVYEDGSQVDTPIATCEIQGYWYAAMQIMAALSAVEGRVGDSADYWQSASRLKERFNVDFWMADEQCVALGLDPDKRQIKVVTSNAGQTLTTGIVDRQHLPQLVARLFEPDIFSGWGIRTLSARNPAYNPLSYHLGSVWPVENATLLFGLKRFGFEREVQILARALYDLALMWRGHRIPECIGGYSRDESRHPGAFPQANAPQTWNQSVFPILIQTLLGILPMAPMKLLTVYPVLPAWLPDVTLRNLRVGDARVSLRFRRKDNGKTTFEVVDQQGTLHVVLQPSIQSLTAGIWDRLRLLRKETDAA